MENDWLTFLYPLGYLSTILFSIRFMIQWFYSEKQQASSVTPSFWWFSLAGNVALWIHSVLQLQFHVALSQSFNGVISWRNLNLMGPSQKRRPLKLVFYLFFVFVLVTITFFIGESDWFRVPRHSFSDEISVSPWWHVLGFLAIFLFNFRFIVQWWLAEKNQKSALTASFWWLSLSGGILSFVYFSYLRDTVNLIGPGLGVIPYVRNLMLMNKKMEIA